MTGRKQNHVFPRGNFGGGAMKRPGISNQNRSRSGGGKTGSSSGSLLNQVNPWLPQNNAGSLGNFGRNIGADPQAQLALASNLLNNLLAPSSALNKFTQPPSLLSLGGLSNSSSFGGSPFSRDRFGIPRSNLGKIQKHDDFKTAGKNKHFGDRKNQKKDQNNKKGTDQKNAEKKDVAKKEENKVSKTDDYQSVSGEDREKTPNDLPMDTDENNDESKKSVDEELKVRYCEIPPALLFCHICRKHMWDESSFEKHLEGRPHKMMVEEQDRCYKLKVDFLRHETRVVEHQREIDMKRAHRKGYNKVKMQQRGFCTMCDLSFFGTLPAHRKNERHQRLKKFLHPKCNACSKEFYTRLEWDDHKLTAAHLKKLAETREKRRPDLDPTDFDIMDFIDDVNEELEGALVDIRVFGKRETLDKLKEEHPSISHSEIEEPEVIENETEVMDENEKEEADETEKEEKDEIEKEKNETEKEEKCEEDEESKKLPKYVPGIPVGLNFVAERTGFLCRACNRFITSPEDTNIHCQTLIHYNNTIRFLKIQNKIVFGKRRLNEVKTEDEDKADVVTEIDEVSEMNEVDDVDKVDETDDGNRIKGQELDEDAATVVNGSVSGGTPPKDEPSPPEETDKYNPEDPESETEKDSENVANEPIKAEKVLEAVEQEVIAEVLKAVQVSPGDVNGEKKNAKTAGRGQRARRSRRN